MTPRQAKLADAATACERAARDLELDFPKADLSDPMVPRLRKELIATRHRDIAGLQLAARTVLAIAEDPDAFGLLIELWMKKRAEFDAIMVLVKVELESVAA